jgi:hypothetical protein
MTSRLIARWKQTSFRRMGEVLFYPSEDLMILRAKALVPVGVPVGAIVCVEYWGDNLSLQKWQADVVKGAYGGLAGAVCLGLLAAYTQMWVPGAMIGGTYSAIKTWNHPNRDHPDYA